MSGADHYEVLNVERSASAAEIRSAYRKMALKVHPDQGGNAALFRLVQEAWSTLSDPAKRAAYDRSLDGHTPRPEPRQPAPEPPRQPEPEHQWTWSTDQPWSSTPPGPDQVRSDGAGPVLIYPTFGQWRIPGLVALGVYAVLVGIVLVSTRYDNFMAYVLSVATAAMVVVVLPPHWSRRVPLRGLFKLLGVLMGLGYLVTLLPFVHIGMSGADRALVIALVAGLFVVRFVTGRWSKYYELDRVIDRQAAFEFNLWGTPGEPLVNDTLAAPISPYDALLQRRTANLLDPVLTALPGAKLVNGAQLEAMVVDHLLLNGHRAALIVSLVGPGGTYSLDAYGGLQLDGQPLQSPSPALEAAVESWRRRLRQVDVRGFLIIHPDAGGTVRTQDRADAKVTCLSAQSAARELHAWLQPEGSKVYRTVLYDILHRAPYGLT
ncbi:J domain-containing protein [Kribbella sp.]|uniref:J domain-containing protein n=1 Tax=Kribbella sp. TaxID=1871183 RepID=UPI002D45DAF5|nr:J domain-containing protein [Kribbella sp.]HZX09164.1 J domain-containing protein [Kribbella sp.]